MGNPSSGSARKLLQDLSEVRANLMSSTPAALVAATLTLGSVLAAPAWAALGGNADSAMADAQALRGQLRSTPMVAYDVHQITTGAVVVTEYVARSGQVFAITWHGPTEPNLQQLLGTYFSRVESAAKAAHQANPGIHRQLAVTQSDLVVQVAGRLRSFHGIAYLPALVPQGVSISQLQ
jgi:Protein of unknown function (DUF2844)